MRLEIVAMGDKIQVNGKTFDFSDGVLIINDISELTPIAKGIIEFERLASEVLSDKGKFLLFLKFMYDNSQVGFKDIKDVLGLDKTIALKVITTGYETGILVKKGQWKIVPDMYTAVGRYLKNVLPKPVEEDVSIEMEDFREEKPEVKTKLRRK